MQDQDIDTDGAARRAWEDRVRAGVAAHLVGLATGIAPEAIASTSRADNRVCHARRRTMYLMHVGYGWPLHRVGAVFQRDRTTAGQACRRVEDERDDPEVDALLDGLETAMRASEEALSLAVAARS